MICPRCRFESAYSMSTCPRCGTPWRADPFQETGTPVIAGTAEGSWAPAGARTPARAARHGGPAISDRTPAQAQAFGIDPARWTTTDRIAGAATLVLFISLFLPWFTASSYLGGVLIASSTADALTAHRYLYLVLIVALVIIGYLVVYAGRKDTLGLRVTHERLLAAASGINLLLVLVAVVFKPAGVTPLVKVSWNFGAFVGLIAAIVAVAPLARSALQSRQSRPSR